MIHDKPQIWPQEVQQRGKYGLDEAAGLRVLLQIRGIQVLTEIFSNYIKNQYSEEVRAVFVEAPQVLKQSYPQHKLPKTDAWKLNRTRKIE